MGLKERREREKEARRRQILDAARHLLFTKGLQSTSINQIARRAELGVGTIYFYFQSKEEIFYALQEEGLGILFEEIRHLDAPEVSPDEQLRQTGLTYLRFADVHRNYFDIINYFLSAPSVMLGPELKTRIDHQGSRILDLIEGFIQAGIEAGLFRPVDAKRYAVMFWGALHGLTQFKKLEETVLDGQDHGQLCAYAIEQLILGLRDS
jgi:AcrR family transcriptional regulator